MPHILQHLAKDLLELDPDALRNTLVVVPTRRSGLFLKKTLANQSKGPIWAPQMHTLDALAAQCIGMQRGERTDLLMRLYPLFRDIVYPEPFEKFYFWGTVLLDEFEALDQALAKASKVFRVLQNQKEIDLAFPEISEAARARVWEFWQGFQPKASQEQGAFLEMWAKLNPLYDSFQELLDVAALTYPGRSLKKLAFRPELLRNLNTERVFVLDPGWISPAAEKVLQELAATIAFQVTWQSCALFEKFNNDPHIKKRLKWETMPQSQKNSAKENPPKVEHWLAEGSEGLCAALPKCLPNAPEEADKTALVVLNDAYIQAVLAHLPPNLEVNVSLGLPLRQSFVNGWLESLRQVFLSVSEAQAGEPRVGMRQLLQFIELHPWPKKIQPTIECWRVEVLKSGVSSTEIEPLVSQDWLKPWLSPLARTQEAVLPLIQQWVDALIESPWEGKPEERYSLWHFANQLRRVRQGLEELEEPLSEMASWKIVKQLLFSLKVPFQGEPLKGLQVLGLRETDCLDFDRVIFLEANEGFLPKQNGAPSLIPDFLRESFGLSNTASEQRKEALLVFRLMEQAKEVLFLTNSQTQALGSAEPSRFLSWWSMLHGQMTKVLPNDAPKAVLLEPLPIPKHGKVGELLQNYIGHKSLSATAINTYNSCGLRFYFKYLAEIAEEKTPEEQTSAKMVGKLTHRSLELIYQQLPPGSLLQHDWLESASRPQAIEQKVKEAMAEYFAPQKLPPTNQGELLLARSITQAFVKRVLAGDATFSNRLIMGEQELLLTWKQELSPGLEWKFKGFADRTDEIINSDGKCFRLVDYKTGSPPPGGSTKISAIQDLFGNEKPPNKEGFQVFFYGWLAHRMGLAKGMSILPQLWYVRGASPPEAMKFNQKSISDVVPHLDDFEAELKKRLMELADPEMDFKPTSHLATCRTCPYRNICNR